MCMSPALFYLANVFFFPHIYFVVFALSPVWLIVRLFARLSVCRREVCQPHFVLCSKVRETM